MYRIPVVSTNVASIGFAFSSVPLPDSAGHHISQGDIEVEFKDATIGIYRAVPYEVYRKVITADSVGRALRYHVKLAGFEWTELSRKGIPSCQ